jgi:O-antigen/teichoic acid export membrane protein
MAVQSLFPLMEVALGAFGLVVLPKAAELVAQGRLDFLRKRIRDIIAMTTHLGLYGSLQLLVWSDELILLWLGDEYRGAIALLRVYVVGLWPYLLYIMLRSVVDVVDERAVNTRNLFIAFSVALSSSVALGRVGLGVQGVAWGVTLGFVTLGLATMAYLWRRNWCVLTGLLIKECLFFSAGALGVGLALKAVLLGLSVSPFGRIAIGSLTAGGLLLIYLLVLKSLGAGWLMEACYRIVRTGTRCGASEGFESD